VSLKLIAAKDVSTLATIEGVASNDGELFGLIDPAVEQCYPCAASLGRPAAKKAQSRRFVLPTAGAQGLGAVVGGPSMQSARPHFHEFDRRPERTQGGR
jgi:hypothetical protein